MAERAVVDVRGVRVRFGSRVALDALSLAVPAGGVVGLVGGNGGGKTTAMRVLAGLLAPDAGEGHVLGRPLADARGIRARVGYCAQRLALYAELSVYENLRFRAAVHGLPARREALRAIEAFDLGGHETTRAGHLSGGWTRRLQLAAALIHRPALALLDEPTAGLDAAARQDVWRRIADLAAAGAGVVVSTHDLDEAEWCDRVLMLDAGRVIAEGTPAAVARGAPATAFVLTGGDRRTLARRVRDVAGVVASYPQAAGLRVVAAEESERDLAALACAGGARLERDGARLADAALALVGRGPERA